MNSSKSMYNMFQCYQCFCLVYCFLLDSKDYTHFTISFYMLQPYLHESRHLHAMRRARGCGGRFLNTKKLEGNNNSNVTVKKCNNNDEFTATISNSSHSSASLNTNNKYQGSSNDHHYASVSMVQNMHKAHSFSMGYHDGSALLSVYQPHGRMEP